MEKFDKETVERWRGMARDWMHANTLFEPISILRGVDAWAIAHNCGICREAYADRNVIDAHIQTALEKIFPNAVFLDNEIY